MVEFLTTEGVSDRLTNILREANEFVWLVSPFINPGDRLKERIDDTQKTGVRMSLIYGKKQRQRGREDWFTSRKWISTYYYEELHAKCYLNEKKALLTSMNLVEYSEQNNREMGILISRKDEPKVYTQILAEIESIKGASKAINISPTNLKVGEVNGESSVAEGLIQESPVAYGVQLKGFCIQCKATIDFNRERPLCGTDYWTKGRTKPKNFCHRCAQPYQATIKKPLCDACYTSLPIPSETSFGAKRG